MKPSTAISQLVELNDFPYMVVMIGVPGSGKSTFMQKMREAELKFKIASTDELLEEYARKHNINYSQAFQKANFKYLQRQMMEQFHLDVKNRDDIVVDRTNMSRKSRKVFLESVASASSDHAKIALNFSLPEKTLFERLDARAKATGKDIPRGVVMNMFKNYDAPSKDEGFDYVFEIDNS